MVNVFLIVSSHFEALQLRRMIDWEANGYQLVIEQNAISGIQHLSEIQPDILLLHSDVKWLDAQEYLRYIKRMFLPTQMILLMSRMTKKVWGDREVYINEDVQTLEFESLSPETLLHALELASAHVEKTEETVIRDHEKRLPRSTLFLADLAEGMSERGLCLMRLVIGKKRLPYAVEQQIETAFITQFKHSFQGSWYREESGNYCVLIDLEESYSAYSRVELMNDLAQTMLHSMKEIILGSAFFTICYKAQKQDLEREYGKLLRLEPYHFFNREMELLSESAIRRFRQKVMPQEIHGLVWEIYERMVRCDLVGVQQKLQELYLENLKKAMSFELQDYTRMLLEEIIRIFYKVLRRADLPGFEGKHGDRVFFSIEQELEEYAELFQKVVEEEVHDKGGKNLQVTAAFQKLMTEFPNMLSMNLIAEDLKISPSYLSRVYKTQMKRGLSESLNMIRMEWANLRIKMGVYDIQKIAELCGYEDAKYFTRVFKKYFGEVPSKWIARVKREEKYWGGVEEHALC